jgi:murein L,D-transpeptidase YcbB/YkuD
VSFARPVLVSLALATLVAAAPARAAVDDTAIRTILAQSGPDLRIAGRSLDVADLKRFYAARDFRPAWSGADGDHILAAIRAVALTQGLPPADYAVPAEQPPLPAGDRDLLISDSLARLGHDLAHGRVAAAARYGELGPQTGPAVDIADFLKQSAAGTPLATLTDRLEPADPAYRDLVKALARYRAIVAAGGWPTIPAGPAIHPGQSDPRIRLVRRRLAASGDLTGAGPHDRSDILDHELTRAVRHFQARHGLERDGIVGALTLAALNVPATARLTTIEVNLERRRSMLRDLGATYVAVNIPAEHLDLVQGGASTLAMRVIVGRPKNQTPILATTMSAVILNPDWTVPPSIASREILPKLKKDPNYLVTNNMYIVGAFPEGSPQSEGLGIDWSKYKKHFPYRLRQRPGPDNALGRIKFHLTDSEAIYMHDTPERTLFKLDKRALSHGCVRLQKPLEMAEHLLGDQWSARLQEILAKKALRTLHLAHSLPVYFLYWTAWADRDGEVQFRNDLYGLDGHLLSALSRNGIPETGRLADSDRKRSL